jgi:hypothetical protein
MESFYEVLTRWQPFFSAVAGVAATLAGLLFVSLSLNRDKITAEENRVFMRLARRTFGNLLYTLMLALMFLVPNHHAYGLAMALFCIVTIRGLWFLRIMVRGRDSATVQPVRWREQTIELLAFLGLLIASVAISSGQYIGIFLLVPVVALLLYRASMNAWLLLIMEKNAANGAQPPADSRDSGT